MTGLGLYETLRILMPGWFVVAFIDVSVRIAFIGNPVSVAGTLQDFFEAIENPVIALGLALIAGLILYAIDIPAKTHVMRVGDPRSDKGLPSAHLKAMLSNEDFRHRSMSVYFLLLDRYMHPETHRRIYLFGSLFRIFVDLRVLAGFFLVLAAISGLLVAGPERDTGASSRELLSWSIVTAAVWLSGYAFGLGQHAVNSARKHKSDVADFVKRHGPSTLAIWPVAVLALAVNGLGVATAITDIQFLLAVTMAAAGFALWLRLEIGPPTGIDYWGGIWWRVVQLTGVEVDEGLSVHQRAIMDVATFGPWMLGAAYLTSVLGRDAAWIAGWLVFLVPLGLVLGFHKHEERLRNTYGDQNTWLDLHAKEIATLDESGQLPSSWS